jgi:FMN-dependent NADH-azoreductase
MSSLLHLSCSPHGAASHSGRAAATTIARLRQCAPDLRLVERTLGSAPPPHPDAAFAEASLLRAEERGPAQRAALALSETLLAELEESDYLLISTPLHNLMLPSSLKAWIDHVVRPGRSFGITPQGKRGLLRDRPVRVLLACGGPHGGDGPPDFVTPYLRHVLATIGLHDVEVLALPNLRRGAEALEAARAALERWNDAQAAAWPGRTG